MRFTALLPLLLAASFGTIGAEIVSRSVEDDAKAWLTNYTREGEKHVFAEVLAAWNYYTNITDANREEMSAQDAALSQWSLEQAHVANTFDTSQINDESTKRQLRMIGTVGINLTLADSLTLSSLVANMTGIYNTHSICSWANGSQDCSVMWKLDPDIFNVLASSRDYDLLTYIWTEWRRVTKSIKPYYEEFVQLSNQGAVNGGFADTGAWWRSWYDVPDFADQMKSTFNEILPLYEELHTYVRRQLRRYYAGRFNTSAIPAHIFGNMWAQDWQNIYDITQPFPNKPTLDVTAEMIRQQYTPDSMFHTADSFFQGLGLLGMTPAFWNGTIMTRPTDRGFVCHASSWDFYNRVDFRIKMCTDVTMSDLETIHHEMGHIEYFMQYKDQPLPFRDGANPGFHEAIGDTIALSVRTPAHLHSIGLLPNLVNDEEQDLNYLFSQALDNLSFLPFGYLIDAWRWKVFDGSLHSADWNAGWWMMRGQYQGITPPEPRMMDDFDPASKSHIDDNTPYIRYFVRTIAMFQFYKAMCDAAGHQGPLYRCDFSNNTMAGEKLAQMMRMGSSMPWPDAMQALTGQRDLNAAAMFEYYRTLYDYLKKSNMEARDCYGWAAPWPADVMGHLSKPRCGVELNDENDDANLWLKQYNIDAQKVFFRDNEANYDHEVDLNNTQKEKAVAEADAAAAAFMQQKAMEAERFDIDNITDYYSRRRLQKIGNVGIALDTNDTKMLSSIVSTMSKMYSTGKVCSFNVTTGQPDCSVMWNLAKDLTNKMATERDPRLLKYMWQAWRDAVGRPMKAPYEDFVSLSNKGAKAGGYADTGDWWRSWYEQPNFRQDMERLWSQVLPFYEQLHAYVRKNLRMKYPDDTLGFMIPAHLTGNMWAQSWENIFDFTAPYPSLPSIDVTANMIAQNYTVDQMFHTAEEFFTSLGLIKMPESFWNCTLMMQPPDRQVVCHASAWDFLDGKKFCIKLCAQVNMNDLITIHHEMGHVEYYLQYARLPVTFRSGANPGFHEAIGDTMALAVSTPKHLAAIGLLPDYKPDNRQDLNFLYRQALQKIAFLPFGYIIDKWRWDVFNNTLTPTDWNSGWWEMRQQYQGVAPPMPRDPMDFDPGAKYHVPANYPYIRYFISFVIQFQFYKSMCNASGHHGPLHQCDFYNNADAGAKLSNMLSMGSSRPWPEALQVATGSSEVSAEAMVEYFQPLMDWLKVQNKDECFGWGRKWPASWTGLPMPRCMLNETTHAIQWLKEYNVKASEAYHNKYATMVTWMKDQNDMTKKAADDAAKALIQFDQMSAAKAKTAFPDLSVINDYETRREMKKVQTAGLVLSDADATRFTQIISNMQETFNKGYVCNMSSPHCENSSDPTQKWSRDPTLSMMTANSRDKDLLKYIWKGWRDNTGRKMRTEFLEYVALGNKGARAAGFDDMGDWWRSAYEDDNFIADIESLWKQLLPLYEQLHAYARRKLREEYSIKMENNAIPAHILGNMWAQLWNNIFDFTQPFPGVPSIDVTQNMIDQNYNQTHMFRLAEGFYESIGMYKLFDSFWEKSQLVKPDNTNLTVNCYADSETLYNRKDFVIVMCAKVNMEDFVTIHHEMGHIEYFMAYRNQSVKFKDGANPGFHEAIGDTMALSVNTPVHLHKIGLLSSDQYQPNNTKQQLNFLFRQALSKIAFLPFGFLIDNYRWKVFNGEVNETNLNKGWWDLRFKYQGIVPPVPRSEMDFDPGAKFHVTANVPYIRYFIAFVVEFQFQRALCRESGHTGPLHTCDIFNSKEAGAKLRTMLEMGASKPWPDAMEVVTGQRNMDASAIIDYFAPVMEWLKMENEKTGECFGWGQQWPFDYDLPQPRCQPPTVKEYIREYNQAAQPLMHKFTWLNWVNEKDGTEAHKKAATAAKVALASFERRESKRVRADYDLDQVPDKLDRRELAKIGGISSMLSDNDTATLDGLVHTMEGVFRDGYVCKDQSKPVDYCMPMNCSTMDMPSDKWCRDPTLVDMTATSTDYDQLKHIWQAWRDNTGKHMRDNYKSYVELGNKGAMAAGFTDKGAAWRATYEDPSFQPQLEMLWKQVLPLYEQLHTYVRRKLRTMYPGKFNTNAIPAHILGNMWAQQWNNIYSHTAPYPAVPTIDVTAEMKLQNYTARRMFDTAEAFYKSIGMFQMVDTFYNKSLIEKPTDGRKVVCYASSEDFFDGTFAIKMCTKITMEDLIVIHHEMGHVEYFMAYQNQHLKFRDGANAGFHEAIGDTMALSVATPSHLKQIGLLLDYQENGTQAMQQDMNFLFKQALEKIAFLPFGYLIDNYRWQVFDGRIPMDSLNDGWWFLRYKYQGVVPPVPRSEMDFDPGAKYHVADDVPYIRYFISFVIQFQFQKALCTAAGYSGPLHKCDIYKNKDAGTLLKNVLSLGSSRPWTEAMMMLTGSKTMDAAALMEYFAPLTEFLEKENRKAKDCFGWGYEWPSYYNLSMPRCPKDVPMPHQRVAEPVTPFDATIVWIGLGLLLIVIILMLVMGFLFWTRDRNTGNVSITPLILSPDGVSQDSNFKNSNY